MWIKKMWIKKIVKGKNFLKLTYVIKGSMIGKSVIGKTSCLV